MSRYANELFQRGQLAESAKWYGKVVALEPKNTDVRALYGAVLYRLGKKADAKTELLTALTQDPKHVPSMHGLFFIAMDAKDKTLAAEYIRRIEAAEPDYKGLADLKSRLAAAK